MPDPDAARANVHARQQLVSLLRAHPVETKAASARVAQEVEARRQEVLHKRRWEVQDTLLGIEEAKRKALRWLTTRVVKDRPPRFEDIRGISASRGFNVSRSMAACALHRLKSSRSKKRILEGLAKIASLDAYLDIFARKRLRRSSLPPDRCPSAEDLKNAEREILTRTDDATAQTGFLIGRALAELLDQGIDDPRSDEEWWDAAVMLVVAMEPSLDVESLGIAGLRAWGGGAADEAVFEDPREIRAIVLGACATDGQRPLEPRGAGK